jgi:hypothetical protein
MPPEPAPSRLSRRDAFRIAKTDLRGRMPPAARDTFVTRLLHRVTAKNPKDP